jgi:D-3-phosphoglycerate dehydrogenase
MVSMFKIKVFNKIAPQGLEKLNPEDFKLTEALEEAQAILLRSHKLHDATFPSGLMAIGRAGAGVNNIPVAKCSDQGIVVFNTPGANANAVKELVICGLYLASRNIYQAINYSESIKNKGDEVPTLVEKNKSNFAGCEIRGKKLGVIGLGAIGMMVANDAVNLGLSVEGYDPFISVQHAWGLSRAVQPASSLEKMLAQSDFISINMPLNDKTRGFIDLEKIAKFKKGAVLLNFARGEIVDENALVQSLESHRIAKYVTDFPTAKLLNTINVISIPHLGASTAEAETNCSLMVVDQLKDFLLNGNICNSVNFPDCTIERTGDYRILITNKNIPKMVSQITAVLGEAKLNIQEMVNKSKNDLAYTIVDIDQHPANDVVQNLKAIDGILNLRVIEFN